MSTDRPDPETRTPAVEGGSEPVRPTASERTAELTTGFERRFAQWGRPPQTTFHVGPLPKDRSWARLDEAGPRLRPLDDAVSAQARPQPQPQPRPAAQPGPASRPLSAPRPGPVAGAGFFNGSMIPRAAPTPGMAAFAAPAAARREEPVEVDTRVRPLPPAPGVVPRDHDRPQAAAVAPSVVDPIPVEPVLVEPLPVEPAALERGGMSETRSAARADAEVRPFPDSAIFEESPAAFTPRSVTPKPSRLPLYLSGAAAVLVVGGGLAWFLTHGAAEPSSAIATPIPAKTPTPVAATPVEATPVTATPAETTTSTTPTGAATRATAPRVATPPATTARAATTSAASTTRPATTATRPATAASTPSTRAQPNTAPPPVIVVQPLETAPAPTAARPSQTDPDAPVVTRPQPLD